MEVGVKKGHFSIMHLPDDCLYFIFEKVESSVDRESFGLTCHRFFHIQNSSRRSLKVDFSSSSKNDYPFILDKMLIRFRQLESLSLSGCYELRDSSLTQLRNYGSKLHCLYLECCFRITERALHLVVSSCPCACLSVISLTHCHIRDGGLEILVKSCVSLKELNLASCSCITDRGIRAVVHTCRQLQAIGISNCTAIRGVGFEGCSETLAYLEGDHCHFDDAEGISSILGGGSLEYLNVSSPYLPLKGLGATCPL